MASRTEHHIWCNSQLWPVSECTQCPALWEKYPYDTPEEAAQLSTKYFPAAIPVVDYVLTVEGELGEMKQTLDLIWAADMRAIKMWQAAGPGRELTWPDRAKMIFWLLEENARLQKEVMALAKGRT